MNTEKIIYGMYDDEQELMGAAKSLVSKGVKVTEVYSPFPIHGLDPIIGIRPTRLGDMAFIYGLFGMTMALIGMRYFMVIDWPMNIGGKPNFSLIENLPAFIPVTFEFTVLCACHGMAITYMFRNKTLPGMPASNPDPRTTDNMFVIELNTADNKDFSSEQLSGWLKETPVVELTEKVYTIQEEI